MARRSGLGLDETRLLTRQTDHRRHDAELRRRQVDSAPLQADRLTLPQAGRQEHDPQRFEVIAAGGFADALSLLAGQRVHLRSCQTRQIDEATDVERHEAPTSRLLDRAMENEPGIACGLRRQTTRQDARVQPRDVRRLELEQPDAADRRHDVIGHHAPIAGERARTDRRRRARDPVIKVGADRLAGADLRDEAGVAVGQRRPELLADFG